MNISDIAKMAGVSNAAVSRYFNNGYISETKKEAIRKVVEETGYRPSVQAQTLRTKKTKMIGVIIPKIASFTIGSMVEGIMEVLNDNNYQMLLADTSNNPQKELEYLNVFKDKQVDGVILVATILSPDHKRILRGMKVPVVIVGQRLSGWCCVYHDDYHCMRDMTRLFLDKGCKKIGYIGVTQNDKAVGLARYQGFCDAVTEEGREDVEYYESITGFSIDSGYEKAKELIGQCPDMDGMICATDNLSLGAMQALKEMGYRIPEDICLSGHGDTLYTGVTTPTITTVHYSYQESGSAGAEMLIDLLNKEETVIKEIMLGYSIIENESTDR